MKEAKDIFYHENFEKQLWEKLTEENKNLKIKNKKLVKKARNVQESFDLSNYKVTIKDNILFLDYVKKDGYLSKKELFLQNLKGSKLQKCYIGKELYENLFGSKFLEELYKKTGLCFEDLRDISTMKMKFGDEKGTAGYHFKKDLGFSVQGKDLYGTLREIINISEKCNIHIDLEILLETNELIRYRSS